MNIVGNSYEIREEQGFKVYVLNNQQVEVAIVPELGARLLSLKDLRSRREWLWHPPGKRRLFRNQPGDDFVRGPMAGLDECLPTVAPCEWRGRALPDHGEAWNAAWTVDAQGWETGFLRATLNLELSPFTFERTLELSDNEVRLEYRLANCSPVEEAYLWAMHPLLQLQPGDRLELPETTRALLNGAGWIDALDSAHLPGGCQKVFASPLETGKAAIQNTAAGDRLEFEWDPEENNTLGIWLTRGGWNGLHHFAIEPANGASDLLSEAAGSNHCGAIAGNATTTWRVTIRVGS